ncbi:CRISPR type III-B/RAMP module RAMP protein Cmr6 [Desulfobotulus alkaliphilus]|uniref:CRISPR type III-B/RAMP module RAMP protein Cmr6 n=1 Tax=Desulfobotulus alkaliphilus TaxID=622671 RepID=A0A562R1C5_9BACT|nr:type III-B CRISPR module RAMP protein Cmr6 [Desulfobotulus alkaliphilus]TWI62868.1 CRISPR type III-B/RAMP module RAMP protein Cmr6 [Desulfobotulus alkaliphilus]
MSFEAIRQDHRNIVRGKCENLSFRVAKLNPVIDDWLQNEHGAKDSGLFDMSAFRFPSESAKAYRQSFFRWKEAIGVAGDCEIFEVEALTRILMGTGNASVFEFGFQLNYPWGVPTIPGSSLKGLVSSYLARHGGDAWSRHQTKTAVKSDAQVELFGGIRETDDKAQSYAGTLVFHDAWLSPWERRGSGGDWFDSDIITPHHAKYYGANNSLPSGMEDPVPIKMAALRPGLTFLVVIQGPEEYRKLAREVLIEALREEGIGGKRAVGYGRFAYVLSEEEKTAEIRKSIENATDAETLQALYRQHKGNSPLRPYFVKAIERLKFADSLKPVMEALMPLALLRMQVEKGEHKDLKGLNQRFKNLKGVLENWQKDEDLENMKHATDARAIFDLMLKKWPSEVRAGAELGVVKNLAYGWEDMGLSHNPDAILEIIEGDERTWPLLKDLPAFLETLKDQMEKEDWELLSMTLEEKLGKT